MAPRCTAPRLTLFIPPQYVAAPFVGFVADPPGSIALKTKLRDTWNSGRGAVNGWLSSPNAVIAEVTGKAGFDSVTIDLQHGLNDYQAALAMLQALAASDSTPMARVPGSNRGSS